MIAHFNCLFGTIVVIVLSELAVAGETVQLVPVDIDVDGRVPGERVHASKIVMSKNGRFVYATRATSDALYAYARDPQSGKLELKAQLTARTINARQVLTGTPDSRFLFVSDLRSNLFSFAANGLTGALTEPQRIENGKNGVVGLKSVTYSCMSPDGKSLYVAGLRDKSLVCFRVDPTTGIITFEECLQSAKAGQAHPGTSIVLVKAITEARRIESFGTIQAMACSPDGQHVLVASDDGGNALTVFARDQENGRLVQMQTLDDPFPITNNIRNLTAIAFHPSGTHAVVSCRFGGISLLERDEDGYLSFVEAYVDSGTLPEPRGKLRITEGLKNSDDVAWTPDGRALFVASRGEKPIDGTIVGFRFDQEANQLRPVVCIRPTDGIEGLLGVSSLAISPDCRFLYAGSLDATVTAFEIKVTKEAE